MEKNTTAKLQKTDGENNENEIVCEQCNDTGVIEIMGDGANFEWDVIGTRPCICMED